MSKSERMQFAVFHRRFLICSRMKTSFEDTLKDVQEGKISADHPDVTTFLHFWYASLYVVTEGWKNFSDFKNKEIDDLINDKKYHNLLLAARNKIYHYNSNYHPPEVVSFITSPGSAQWSRKLHEAFSKFCTKKHLELYPEKDS